MSIASEFGTRDLEKWIVVDLERIRRLPDRLRRLWPTELSPRRPHAEDDDVGASPAGERGTGPRPAGEDDARPRPAGDDDARPRPAGEDDEGSLSAGESDGSPESTGDDDAGVTSVGETIELIDLGESVPGNRELDVLTAWVAGFAAELNQGDVRITVVLSSGVESVQLALCLGPATSQAVLALHGEGFDGFAHHQLLRRIDPRRIGNVVDELAGLVEHDCVLTVNWAARGGAAGLEFLHRRHGAWFRPVLERRGDSITVDADVAAEDDAVRMLVAAVLSRTMSPGVR
ncbi:hypothetical protein [Brevibacterium atlanticum]|uniref:hypothetical protein n=1 Tax=Brevibacterium atlanticum TaxID=2697563 RepID=UPI00141F4073|nr:hypothetical protein [Brevibacterium atlanticum]